MAQGECIGDCPQVVDRRQHDRQLELMQDDIRELQNGHRRLDGDMRVLEHIVKEYTSASAEWHKEHSAEMGQFRRDLKEHMDDEPQIVERILRPVIDSVGTMQQDVRGLYTRWWTIAGTIILLLLGIVGFLVKEQFFP